MSSLQRRTCLGAMNPGSAGILAGESGDGSSPDRTRPAWKPARPATNCEKLESADECRCRIQGFPQRALSEALHCLARPLAVRVSRSSHPVRRWTFPLARNVFRRPVVMPFRPAVGTSPPANSRRAGQAGFTRASVGFAVATQFRKAEPVHFVCTDAANGVLRPSLQ